MGRIRIALATLAALGLIVASRPASAQVVINEILANPIGTDDGTERIEIYNAGMVAVDMTGWAIDDAATIDNATVRCRIPEDFDLSCPGGVIIQPGEFRVLKGTTTPAWVNNGTETIYLVAGRTVGSPVMHQVSYASATEGAGYAALPNGSANFAWRDLTLCATNGSLGDTTPPSAVVDLLAVPGAFPGEVRITWTAPGDDGMTGTASLYQMRVAAAPITDGTFNAAADVERWIDDLLPDAAGTPETLYVFGMHPDTTYYFALKTQDEVPNTSALSNVTSTAPLAGPLMDPDLGYSTYFGNLHSHTGYSDGVQTPADAYFYARNTAPTPLDFLEVSEHNHGAVGMSLPNYSLGLLQADGANDDGDFVALYGQEWGISNAGEGHANVIQAPVLFGWESGNYDVFVAQGDYPALYTAAIANPPDGGHPPIVHWCHPATSDFNGMAVTPDGLSVVHLIALVNGPAFSTATDESDVGNTNFDGAFHEALRKGYRVSPTGDQDNHNANWGSSTQSRTAVLANAKTRSDILQSLAARRTYATQDHNVDVDFSANGHAMGEAFASPAGVRLAVRVTDPDPGDAVAQIELFRGITGGAVATRIAYSLGNPEFTWRELDTFPPGTEAHYYLRIRMADNQSIWTGPVYVTYDASSPTAVGGSPDAPGLRLSAHPIPSRGSVTAEFALSRDEERARVTVYDLSGRRVRALWDRPLAAGPHRLAWDGKDDLGQPARGGVFFLRLETSKESVSRKILLLQ